jgi:hypoxanthine-guanine phosphoribosyltransferase
VVKQLALKNRPSVTVSGLTVDDVYVFGSGMDYRGYWRSLAGIYAVAERT